MASIEAKILLGWMDETEAMACLLREYRGDPPLTEAEAKKLWNEYRGKVAQLQPRECPPPKYLLDRTQKEEYAEHHFLQKFAKVPRILRVVKIDDPGKLVIQQLMVVMPQSLHYLADMQDPKKRVRTCLGKGLSFEGVHPKARKEGSRLIKPVPHAEFSVKEGTQEDFTLIENDRHIAVKEFNGRLLLAAGYHRAHISMYRSRPEDTVLPLFAAVESDEDGFFSAGSKVPFKRDMVLSSCPPLLADFFDDSLCIKLPLRKCRVEMCVDLNTQVWERLWVDDEP
jgi:hypothetical protein